MRFDLNLIGPGPACVCAVLSSACEHEPVECRVCFDLIPVEGDGETSILVCGGTERGPVGGLSSFDMECDVGLLSVVSACNCDGFVVCEVSA